MPGMGVKFMSTNQNYEIKEVGVFIPKMLPQLASPHARGDVGYFIANIKSTADSPDRRDFDRFQEARAEPLPGFRKCIPMVFSGISVRSIRLISNISKRLCPKLQLNDSAFVSSAGEFCRSGIWLSVRLWASRTWKSSRNGSGVSTAWILSPLIQARRLRSHQNQRRAH